MSCIIRIGLKNNLRFFEKVKKSFEGCVHKSVFKKTDFVKVLQFLKKMIK